VSEEVKERMKDSAYRLLFDCSLKLKASSTWVDGFTLRCMNEAKDILQIAPHEFNSKAIDPEFRVKANRSGIRHYIRRGLS